MITYILQIIIFQVLFLAVYDFFLSKETFYNYNRLYLLGTPMLSFVLPLIKIPTMQKVVPEKLMVYIPEVMLSPQRVIEKTTFYTEGSINYLSLLFWCGVVLFAVVFLVKLFKIGQLISKNEILNKIFYKLVLLPQKTSAFSFFNFIFLGKEISKEKQEQIIEHELIHSKQRHSLDLMFFEFLRIFMWFNPMIYIYQHRITLLHEYVSDAAIIKGTNKQEYFNTILSQTFQVENISFVNQFYKHSLIKKRITMMTKNKSKQMKKAKYLVLLPLLASMLIYTSCETKDWLQEIPVNQNEKVVNASTVSELPYSLIEEVIVGDKSGVMEVSTNDKLSSTVRLFVAKNFNADISKTLNLKENKFKIYSVFTVNTKGEVEDIKIRAPHPELEKETERVLTLLPILVPASKDGKYVAMKYTLPISSNNGFNKLNPKKEEGNYIPLAIIEHPPVFPGCKGTREQKIKCLNTGIQKHVLKNFNIDVSKNIGLTSGKKKVYVVFKIDENGDIVDVNARAPHLTLKEEAIRVAKTLPKMIAGKQRGISVGVKYTLPITFNIE